MKKIVFVFCTLLSLISNAQNSMNMSLLYHWKDTTLIPSTQHDNTYNEIWGYTKNGREYAIIGSSAGTHIFDITDVNNVDTTYFIAGKGQGAGVVHRDYDTYKDYLYIVGDETPASLQIADLSFLPDSAPLVYDSDTLIKRAHNIFIDTLSGNLYVCGGQTNLGGNQLSLYSLKNNPLNPQFMLNCANDVSFWSGTVGYVHDIYVRNDTAYCNAGTNGLFVVDFNDSANVKLIGSLTNYVQQGYNHSGWLHKNGKYYAFADETHGTDVKIVNVSNLNNITLVDTIGSNVIQSLSIPHNLIFKDDFLYVSFYFDGTYIFDVHNPNNITTVGYYDTSTRPAQLNKYQGNWGVYPLLPSGKVLASDMQEGLFVYDVSQATAINELSLKNGSNALIYPNPAQNNLTIIKPWLSNNITYFITDLSGRIIKQGQLLQLKSILDITNLKTGFYLLSIVHPNGNVVSKKLVKE